MKKVYVFIFTLCLLAAVPASAQLKFGIKAGTNLTDKPSKFDGDVDGCTGFFVGPMAKFTLPIVGLGVEADVLYSHSGVELGGTKVKKNSIEIPVYLRYDLALPAVSKIVVPFVAVGPQFGYTIGNADETFDDATYEYKKSQLSLNFGLGAILFGHLQAHVNYNMALGNTSELKSLDGTFDAIKSKTDIWQISVAYLF